jgi:hypothetical protein
MTDPSGTPSLGRSLKLQGGDLVFDPDTADLALVEDLETLKQALVLSIETQLGSDPINAGFGFDRVAVSAYANGIHARKEYVKLQIVRCVSADRRVSDVREVFFQDDPRFFELRPDLGEQAQNQIVATARASRDYTLYVIVETIASSTLTLPVGGTLG